jgi:hypothetical protein
MKRRWFRFSLRTLLIFVTVSAVATGWHTHRQRIIKAEAQRLYGRWKVIEEELGGYVGELSEGDFKIGVPKDGVGWIDFMCNDPNVAPGTLASRGIYKFEGNKLIVAQNEMGKPRPTSFDESEAKSVWSAWREEVPATPK